MAGPSIESVLKIISNVSCAVEEVIREKPYGIVHKSARIHYGKQSGRLVWDYIIWNELTFEDDDTHRKISLMNNLSDKKTEEMFDELVSKYGE